MNSVRVVRKVYLQSKLPLTLSKHVNFSNTHIGTSVSVVLGFLFLLLLPFDLILIPFGLDGFKTHHLGDGLKNIFIALFGIILIIRLGYLKVSGITNPIPKNVFLFIIPLYFLLLGPIEYYILGYQFSAIETVDVLILLFSSLTVGLSEEVIFRGLVLPNLIKGSSSDQPLIVPILTASLLFGVLHFLNLLQPDKHFHLVLSQVLYATMFGVAFGIILLRTGSLFGLGLLHGLINFSSNWDDLPGAVEPDGVDLYRTYEAIIAVLVVLPFFVYMVRQLSKIDRNHVMKLFDRTL